jgi:hypothetical protein
LAALIAQQQRSVIPLGMSDSPTKNNQSFEQSYQQLRSEKNDLDAKVQK